jgi:long-chain fatty acid transport protein
MRRRLVDASTARHVMVSVLACSTLLAARVADAAGVAVLEQSARLTGTAYAGTAALAEDASMGFFNPAGLTRLRGGSLAATATVIDANADFTATSATTWGQTVTGPDGSLSTTGGDSGVLPTFHIAQRLAERWVGYLSVTSPLDVITDYPDDSVTRYVGTLSQLKTVHVNPAVAWEPIDHFSVGAGFNAEYMKGRFNQKYAIPTIPFDTLFGRSIGDINALLEADDWAFGWNGGLLWEIDPTARVGVAYRSAIHHTLTGTGKLLLPDVPVVLPDGARIPIGTRTGFTTPQNVILSGVWSPFDWLQLLADAQWTNWSALKQLSISFSYPQDVTQKLGPLASLLPTHDSIYEGFRDAWRGAVGAQLFVDDHLTLRFGSGFDQSPVYNANRTIRLPDGNRVLLALGFGYRFREQTWVDFGYTHYFISDGTVNETNQTLDASNIQGSFETSGDVFALQLTHNWDRVPWEGLPFFSGGSGS